MSLFLCIFACCLNVMAFKFGPVLSILTFCLLSCPPTGRLPQLRGRRMTRVNREVKRSPDRRKKELTKAAAERRTARAAVLLVGAAGQRLLYVDINKCCQVPISLFPVIFVIYTFFI